MCCEQTFMAGVNKVREAERQKAKEARKLARAVRVDAVHRECSSGRLWALGSDCFALV